MPTKTKILTAAAGFLLLGTLIVQGEIGMPSAFAQDKVLNDTQGGIMGNLLFGVGSLNFLAFFLLKLLSYLLDPETIVGLGNSASTGMMLRLWQISRDLMNIIFAILLLGGAIMTIVLGKQEIVKQHLVKFILAVILVNFSWFFPRVILDIANVTAATIYGLPKLVNSQCKWIDDKGAAQPCVVVNDILFFEDAKKDCQPGETPKEMGGIMKVCLGSLLPGTNNGFGIVNGLVTNHGRLVYLGVIAGSPPAGGVGGTVKEFLRFTIILVMVTFLHVMLVFPLAALTVAMIIRIPILWLTISFMPFMFIGFIIGEKFIKVNSMEIFTKHFMTAAFLPAIVAAPFAIGYIMLNEVARLSAHAPGGSPLLPPPAGLEGKVPFFPQAENWWQVIWILLAFMVIWMGSRIAMKRDEIYSQFTEPIFNVGKSFLKLPVTVPLIPHDTNGDGVRGKGEKIGLGAFGNKLQTPQGWLSIAPIGKPAPGGAIAPSNGKNLDATLKDLKQPGLPPDQQRQNVTALQTLLRDLGHNVKDVTSAIQALKERNEKLPEPQRQSNDDLAKIEATLQAHKAELEK